MQGDDGAQSSGAIVSERHAFVTIERGMVEHHFV
jgi:hypothetical protein